MPEESGLVKPSSRSYLSLLTLITPLGMLSGSVESLVSPDGFVVYPYAFMGENIFGSAHHERLESSFIKWSCVPL